MDEKIDPGLFARLMQLSPRARNDILEYLGQGPVSSQAMLNGVLRTPSAAASLRLSPSKPPTKGGAAEQ